MAYGWHEMGDGTQRHVGDVPSRSRQNSDGGAGAKNVQNKGSGHHAKHGEYARSCTPLLLTFFVFHPLDSTSQRMKKPRQPAEHLRATQFVNLVSLLSGAE